MGSGRKPVGVVVGLAGNIAVGWALFHLIQIGSCGGDDAPACPPDSWPYFVAMPVGIVLSVVSSFVGGAAFGVGTLFLAIGLGSVAAGIWGDAGTDRAFAYVFGGAFTFFGLLPLLAGLAGGPVMRRRVERAEKLVATGRRGIGTLVDVRDTGVTINENPRVELRMRVEPLDGGAPLELTKTRTVSRVEIPRVGERFPVFYDPADPDHWYYATDAGPNATADIRRLFELAGRTGDVQFNAPAAAPAAPAPGPLDEIAKLNDLRMKGALSDEEFQTAKDRLLAQIGGGPPAPTP